MVLRVDTGRLNLETCHMNSKSSRIPNVSFGEVDMAA